MTKARNKGKKYKQDNESKEIINKNKIIEGKGEEKKTKELIKIKNRKKNDYSKA